MEGRHPTTVLSGLWTGRRYIGDLAVYGWLLSTDRLGRKELTAIRERRKIHICLDSTLFHHSIQASG